MPKLTLEQVLDAKARMSREAQTPFSASGIQQAFLWEHRAELLSFAENALQPPGSIVWVNGIVAARDKQPYIQLDVNGRLAQLTMSQARQIATDLQTMCARTEADAMILQFFSKENFPEGAGAAIMVEFRDFRQSLDTDRAERSGDST